MKDFFSKTIILNNVEIHVIVDNDVIVWFNANQLCASLGYKYAKKAISNNVSNFEKKEIQYIVSKKDDRQSLLKSLHPQTIYINESGLYNLLISSKMKEAKQFREWLTTSVVPELRKTGVYSMKKSNNNLLSKLNKKIKTLEENNQQMQCELKREKFPDGALVYAIEYDLPTKENESSKNKNTDKIFRIGISGNMKKRKQLYDTHSVHKKKIVMMKQTNEACKFEYCLKSLLYDYRIKNRKDFYQCSLSILKQAFKHCYDNIKAFNQQIGGGQLNDNIERDITQMIKYSTLEKTQVMNAIKQLQNKFKTLKGKKY